MTIICVTVTILERFLACLNVWGLLWMSKTYSTHEISCKFWVTLSTSCKISVSIYHIMLWERKNMLKIYLPGRRRAAEQYNKQLFMDDFTWIQLSWFLSDD